MRGRDSVKVRPSLSAICCTHYAYLTIRDALVIPQNCFVRLDFFRSEGGWRHLGKGSGGKWCQYYMLYVVSGAGAGKEVPQSGFCACSFQSSWSLSCEWL